MHELNALSVPTQSFSKTVPLFESVQNSVRERLHVLDERSEEFVQRTDARREALLQSLEFFKKAVGAFEKLDECDKQLQSVMASVESGQQSTSAREQTRALVEESLIRLQRGAEECAVCAIRDGRHLLDRVGTGPGTEGVQQCVSHLILFLSISFYQFIKCSPL